MTPLANKPSPVQRRECAEESDATGSSDEEEHTEEEWQQKVSAAKMRILTLRRPVQSQEAQLIIGKRKVEANNIMLQHLQQLELLITGRQLVGWEESPMHQLHHRPLNIVLQILPTISPDSEWVS